MEQFFDNLARIGIREGPDAYEVIGRQDASTLRKTLEDCFWLANADTPKYRPGDLFNFAANSAMSGGTYPCSDTQCRLRSAHNLSVFAALYGDAVLVPNFFDYYYHSSLNLRSAARRQNLAQRLIGDISVYLQYRPLLDAGLVQVTPTVTALCQHCLANEFRHQAKLKRQLDRASAKLQKRLAGRLVFNLHEDNYVSISDPEQLLESENPGFVLPAKLAHKLDTPGPRTLDEAEIDLLGIRQQLISLVFDDLVLQKWSRYTAGTTCLTSRKLDSEAIESVKPERRSSPNLLPAALEHSIPFIEEVDIDRALALRASDGESFENYREKLRSLVASSASKSATDLATAVRDTIRPQVASIASIMKRYQKGLRRRAAAEISVSSVTAGVIGTGLFSPASPVMLLVAGTVGGQAVVDYIKSFDVPESASRNPYYFLWKMATSN